MHEKSFEEVSYLFIILIYLIFIKIKHNLIKHNGLSNLYNIIKVFTAIEYLSELRVQRMNETIENIKM